MRQSARKRYHCRTDSRPRFPGYTYSMARFCCDRDTGTCEWYEHLCYWKCFESKGTPWCWVIRECVRLNEWSQSVLMKQTYSWVKVMKCANGYTLCPCPWANIYLHCWRAASSLIRVNTWRAVLSTLNFHVVVSKFVFPYQNQLVGFRRSKGTH